MGPRGVGRIQVPVPSDCPLEGLFQAVAMTLGIPTDLICLSHGPGVPYLETDNDMVVAESIWMSLMVLNQASPFEPHIRVFDGTGQGSFTPRRTYRATKYLSSCVKRWASRMILQVREPLSQLMMGPSGVASSPLRGSLIQFLKDTVPVPCCTFSPSSSFLSRKRTYCHYVHARFRMALGEELSLLSQIRGAPPKAEVAEKAEWQEFKA